jgi:phosphatidylethanolamine-binding protein (PEBP) family uncharacterized protein
MILDVVAVFLFREIDDNETVVSVLASMFLGLAAVAAEGGRAMHLTSPDFAASGEIPTAHTCQGADRAPALAWTDVPAASKSLV